MKVIVEVLEEFVSEMKVGALIVRNVSDNTEQKIDEGRVIRTEYKVGQKVPFNNKRDAQAFCRAHGSKVKLA